MKKRKRLKRIMIIVFILVAVLGGSTWLFMKQAKFGQSPSGERLERIKQSPHYRDGKFQNLSFTPELAEGFSMPKIMFDYVFKSWPRRKPVDTIPSVKRDLLHLPTDANVLVWFGHSSYFMQIDGKRFLVDPVFGGNASPIPGTVSSFAGTDRYTAADLPEIDYLLISHDHYDHVDYETLIALKTKVKQVICGLGVGAHFEHWGYEADRIIEKDWYEKEELAPGFTVNVEPARHFSGRGFSRNNTLWVSYLLQTPSLSIFIGGDSGYDTHYADIGHRYDSVDVAILDNGQYNEAWCYIHHLPADVLNAAKDLKAKRLFPVHSSKFVLANHPWDEPLIKLSELNKSTNIPLFTPMIGELVDLQDAQAVFKPWWLGVN